MARGATYTKFGGVAAPDFGSMIKGQQAVTSSFKDAIGSVDDLLKQTEERYKETNTLNVQEYLKNKIQEQGLGADPIDKTAIQKRFGSLIDMDKVNATISGETKLIHENATNTASQLASKTLSETQNPILARKAFENSLRKAGGKESFISSATQAWSDSNATKFKDIDTLKMNAQNARSDELFSAIHNGMGEDQAVEAIVADLPKNERAAERRRLYGLIDDQGKLRPNAVATRDYYVGKRKIAGQAKIDVAKNNLATLEEQKNAIHAKSIPDSAYTLSKTYAQKLGGSVAKGIGKDVTNFVESWAGSHSDASQINQLYRDYAKDYKADDVNAALALAYSEISTDGTFGNDINSNQFKYIRERVDSLLKAKDAENALATKISEQRQKVSQVQNEVANDLNDFTYKLNQAGRNKQLKVKGAKGIKAAAESTAAFISKVMGTPPPSDTSGGKKKIPPTADGKPAVDSSDPNQIAAKFEENQRLKAEAQSDAQAKENEGITNPQSNKLTPKIGDNPYARSGAAFAGKDGGLMNWWNKRQTAAQITIDSNYKKAATKKANELQKLSVKEQTAYINKLKKAGEAPIYINTLQSKLNQNSNKMSTTDNSNLTKEINKIGTEKSAGKQLSSSMKKALSKMPSTDIAAKEAANLIKIKRPPADWKDIINALKQGNPRLANKIAKLLEVG